ncbi:regulation of vesicle fusion [Trebouxia sp. C0010 RCD-2024]
MIPLYLYYRIQQNKEEEGMADTEENEEKEVVDKKRASPFFRFRAIAGAIGRTAASAGSLLADPELRGRAGAVVGKQAGQSFSSLREGVQQETEYITKRINNGLGYVQSGPRHVQLVLARLQKRIEETRLQALLEAERDAPVDVQIGPQLVEQAHQELRSRLWLVLIDNPHLCHVYDEGKVEPAARSPLAGTFQRSRGSSRSHEGFVSVSSASKSSGNQHGPHSPPSASLAASESAGVHPSSASPSTARGGATVEDTSGSQPPQCNTLGISGESSSSQQDAGGSFKHGLHALDAEQQELQSPAPYTDSQKTARHQSSAELQETEGAHQDMQDLTAAGPTTQVPVTDAQAPVQERKSGESSSTAAASADAASTEAGGDAVNASSVGSASTDAWEMVQDANNIYNWKAGSLFGRSLSSSRRQGSLCSEEGESYSKCLMNAVMTVEWPISTEFSEDSRYNTLLQISVGQEEVDEVIGRDINRTFPEHPQFGFEQGQQALYRVLKAYSLHDLEVGYCQGMAFVAGVILMYLPEEPAFRVLCQLLDGTGVGLRTLYLPGLQGLKDELRMMDWLMERLMPELKQHLDNYGAVPVLYASQWFLTIFSCPFPATLACRVIDVMLTEHSPNIMLRVALAVLAECEDDLLQLHDFEDLITYLKVEPVQWSADHTRTVLSSAIASPNTLCSPPMIEAARLAVQGGYEGTMHM